MFRNVKGKKLSNKLTNQKVFVRPHGGCKVGDIKYHVIPETELRDNPPNHIIVHVGTNEIGTRKNAENIANDIMDVCVKLKNDDNSVSVSGIIYRGDTDENFKVDIVNKCLKLL